MSATTRPPSVILAEIARLVESEAFILRHTLAHCKLRVLIEECQQSVIIRDKELRDFCSQAIRETIESAYPRDPNAGLGAVEKSQCEEVGQDHEQ